MTRSHTDIETLRRENTELRVALKFQTQWRERAEQQLTALAKQYARECAECDGKGQVEVGFLQNKPHGWEPCPDCKHIRDVIAKAEGQSETPAQDDGAPYCPFGHRTKAACACEPIARNE